MDITGAIFDCDGTLVDSMGMWAHAFGWLCERHRVSGVTQEEVESVSLHDGCALLHDKYGVAAPVDELYEQICSHVHEAYVHDVRPFPHVRDLLDELAEAGVPMVVASSTPVRELRCALEAHGLAGYFSDVVSTEDVGGRDKEFPDVYLEAARRLGSDVATTWVFEDAPFGVRTARRAGFAVVGLMNDHDGRREQDVRPWCDIYAHGWEELSLARIRDYERPAGAVSGALEALVVAGSPEPSASALVARLAATADYVVCADRGADACRAAGVAPDVYCGDSDSASPEADAWARTAASTCIGFPSEKYATDLALALDCARHEASRRGEALRLTLTCATGGRPDHALAVLGQLARSGAAAARQVEDGFEMRVVSADADASWELGEAAVGRTFSAVAVAPGTRIDERGMRWELSDHPMGLLDDLGVSNVVTSADASVTCRAGAVAAFLLGAPTQPVAPPDTNATNA
ncbi:thiamine diphosphokinase [Thermophilibacter sp.]